MDVTVVRVPRQAFEGDQTIRGKVDKARHELTELAMDIGLDPARNVFLVQGDDETRIEISDYMDDYLKDTHGTWVQI